MEDPIITIDHVNMQFRLTHEKVNSIKEYFIRMIKKDLRYSDFYALKNISFKVQKGERIGIIGPNGAGKSTLLKIISGIMKPTLGKVQVNGSISPLLELGAGFDDEFSGAENIYLNGAILGKTKKFLDEHFDEIVDYSELAEFIDSPVKNYSSGMKAKLGFSIATQVQSDILIIDEVLGVGDQHFKKKSSAKIKELMEKGITTLLVSHSIEQIKKLTDKTIWLEEGCMKAFGDSLKICERYEAEG